MYVCAVLIQSVIVCHNPINFYHYNVEDATFRIVTHTHTHTGTHLLTSQVWG